MIPHGTDDKFTPTGRVIQSAGVWFVTALIIQVCLMVVRGAFLLFGPLRLAGKSLGYVSAVSLTNTLSILLWVIFLFVMVVAGWRWTRQRLEVLVGIDINRDGFIGAPPLSRQISVPQAMRLGGEDRAEVEDILGNVADIL